MSKKRSFTNATKDDIFVERAMIKIRSSLQTY